LQDLLDDCLTPDDIRDVEDHVQWCPNCRQTLDELVGGGNWLSAVRSNLGDPLAELDEPAVDPLDFLGPSDFPDSLGRIGPYEVKGVLGRGGNGIVMKAFDAGLNRFVAVKVIATVLAGSGAARKRFAREAQAAAAVVHEHVVAVHAVNESAGLPYLVMEYIRGRSLQDRLDKDGPLELTEVLRIGYQTASGLSAAHEQGLVHRDIKPANILLENGVERVKITDFGLARAVADATLTQSGIITGTPHYMAPEQARGDAVDHRADLFGLGSTLYACCTGHPPFRAETPLAVLRRVTDDTPRPIRELNPEIPAWLEALIGKLLAKSVTERYQSAGEVAELFAKCLAHVRQPMSVPMPVIPGIRVPRDVRNRRIAWAAIGMIAAAGLIMLAASPGPKDANKPDQTVSEVPMATGTLSSDPSRMDLPRADVIDASLSKAKREGDRIEAEIKRSSEQYWAIDPTSLEILETQNRAKHLEFELDQPRGAKAPQP